ncbi:MAG: SLC13 family permease [Candidatus Omnitrophota bacterium]
MKLFVVSVFLLTYLGVILFNRKVNPLVMVFTGAFTLLVSQAISLQEALFSINLNVLGVFLGTMILSGLFIYSNVPAYLATHLVSRSKNVAIAILSVCLLSSFISSFTENVATILIVAPIAFEVAKRLKINPVPFLIAIAVSSNLQGSATMIGDSPSIILAMSHDMNFLDFFWMKGRPGIAFFVEIGAIFSFIVLYLIFRRHREKVREMEKVTVKTWVPTILMSLMIFSLVFSSFILDKPYYTVSFICMGYALLGIIWHKIFTKENFSLIKNIDWRTFFFLIGVFILIGSLSHVGIIGDIATFIKNITRGNVFFTFSIIVWASVLFSAFIDNIPYVIAMIPVCKMLSEGMNVNPELLLFGLLIGATLGGNITPIGASANIVSMGMLRERGYKVSFKEFFKIGLPFTLAAVISAYIFLWMVWR